MAADNPMGPVEVPAIPIRPRPRGLLTDVTVDLSLEPLPGNPAVANPEERIGGGVQFCSDACGELSVLENQWCHDTDLPEDYFEAALSGPFYSFWVQADDLSPVRYDTALARSRVEERLRIRHSAAIARELLTGETTGGPSLSSTANTVVDGPVDVSDSLYVLEEILADYDNLAFTIHASPGTFELLVAEFDIAQDDRETADDPNRLPFRTANGHTLVGDAGHDRTVAPEGFSADAAGSWVYASADVALWESDVIPVGDETATFDRARNTRSTVRGRNVLVAFDVCSVVAIQVQVPTFTPVDGPGAPASGD